MIRCQNCLKEIEKAEECPHCGYAMKEENKNFPVGKIIKERYYVGRVFSEDSATRVYLAFDNELNRPVFLREYDGGGMLRAEDEFNFDSETRSQAVARFLNYSKSLASIGMCSVFPKTTDIFEFSQKGYIVTDFFEGESLKNLLKAGVKISADKAIKIAEQLCEGVSVLHRSHMIFGRICPETVYILKETGEVKLFGIGSPFFDAITDFDLKVHHINPSYAPPEIFDKNARKGTFSDTYSIAAILYRMITDEIPPVSFLRANGDDILVPAKYNKNVTKSVSNAILNALNHSIDMRTATPSLLASDLAKEKVKRNLSLKLKFLGFIYKLGSKLGSGPENNDKNPNKKIIALAVLGVLLVAIIALAIILLLPPNEDKNGSQSNLSSENTTSAPDTFYGIEGTSSIAYDFESLLGDTEEQGSTVSSEEYSLCPYVVGKNFEQAKFLLESRGLVVKVKGYEYSKDHAEGNVVSQGTVAGTKLKKGSIIELVISKGEEIFYATVPDVVGMELTAAKAALSKAGFPDAIITFEEVGQNGETAGTVIYQNIKNAEIEVNSTMYLTVVGVKASVPNCVGKSLSELNLDSFSVIYKNESGEELPAETIDKSKYTVLTQSVEPGNYGYVGQQIVLSIKEN